MAMSLTPRRILLLAANALVVALLVAAIGALFFPVAKPEDLMAPPMPTTTPPAVQAPADAVEQPPAAEAAPVILEADTPLLPAPDPAISEETPAGILPIRGDDGRQAWQLYARVSHADQRRPRLAVLLVGIGHSRIVTEHAIRSLPGGVTLGFEASVPDLQAWMDKARQDGHEAWLFVPMEPIDYPQSDPGPESLLASASETDNIKRLQLHLHRGLGAVGVGTLSGSRLTVMAKPLTPILAELKRRGLAVYDTGAIGNAVVRDVATKLQLPYAHADYRLAADLSEGEIDGLLRQALQEARANGHAVVQLGASPLVIDRLNAFLRGTLTQAGVDLAPVTALMQ